jgi:ApaG protein
MIEQITQGIKISVKMKYQGIRLRPGTVISFIHDNALYHTYAYFITIENKSSETVQLTTRFWEIFDALKNIEIIEGEGVVGQTPILEPNDNYSYSSGCYLESTTGAMKGYYTMRNCKTLEEFKVFIPTFQLTTPILSN